MSRVEEVLTQIKTKHLCAFPDHPTPLFKISEQYNGYWLEHAFDALVWSYLSEDGGAMARSHINLFLNRQKSDGQLPFCVRMDEQGQVLVRYRQLQECVSFARLCLETWRFNPDPAELHRYYTACIAWANWQERYRMTTQRGLIETFCGYDTGHDNSGRFSGIRYPEAFSEDARIPPVDCPQAPLLSPDVNAVYYGTLSALAEMAGLLGKRAEQTYWQEKAQAVRDGIFLHCYDPTDGFFYDVDKKGNKIRCKSIAVTALFYERVLTQTEADTLFQRYFMSETEFRSPYPYPSVSQSDPTFKDPGSFNSWGYFSQALTALRTLRWMPHYGYTEEWHRLLRIWHSAWEASSHPFGQELHPITGEPSPSSPYYSSCMLLYLLAEKIL